MHTVIFSAKNFSQKALGDWILEHLNQISEFESAFFIKARPKKKQHLALKDCLLHFPCSVIIVNIYIYLVLCCKTMRYSSCEFACYKSGLFKGGCLFHQNSFKVGGLFEGGGYRGKSMLFGKITDFIYSIRRRYIENRENVSRNHV